MNSKIIVFILGFVLICSGCITYRSYVPIDYKEVNLGVPLSIKSILIEDKRQEISPEDDIKIPFMSGLKRKSWKHHPKLTEEHKSIIESTIRKNFNNMSPDSAEIRVLINYACKEFEQTGVGEIERIYLNIETSLKSNLFESTAMAVDTFYYESNDASNKHFEKFYQTSLRNSIVRNVAYLRNAYFNTEIIENNCFDSSHSDSIVIENLKLIISGEEQISSIEIDRDFEANITQIWNFKISTNSSGEINYVELLDDPGDKKDEIRILLKYLDNMIIKKFDVNKESIQTCWKLVVEPHER